ncbi:MAG: CNP1-like family protein [Neisseria sp.]|uniref:CNP1-like family protein n=1 Tax=Neisseria sp. TaxID=192066 RepID=UPI0026DAEF88|nr:CNP1-like family protein [Neisseria sp.]MDO4641577.1 CNP1-like family protein [Neisseria sp.]
MYRFVLLLALAAPVAAFAVPRSEKDSQVNTRYIERNPQDADERFKEAETELPPLPDNNAQWFDLYVSPDFTQKPKIDLNSIVLAPDGTVRYTLNVQSASGYDNLTAEGLYCAEATFNTKKKSSYKIYGYGDTVNHRWIQPRNPQWRDIGAILNSADPVRGTLYRAFCEDGLPGSREKLIERLKARSGTHSKFHWTK